MWLGDPEDTSGFNVSLYVLTDECGLSLQFSHKQGDGSSLYRLVCLTKFKHMGF